MPSSKDNQWVHVYGSDLTETMLSAFPNSSVETREWKTMLNAYFFATLHFYLPFVIKKTHELLADNFGPCVQGESIQKHFDEVKISLMVSDGQDL